MTRLLYLRTITYPYSPLENYIVVGSVSEFSHSEGDVFEGLKEFREVNNDYIFGYFSYDLKNEIEKLNLKTLISSKPRKPYFLFLSILSKLNLPAYSYILFQTLMLFFKKSKTSR